MSGVVVVEGDSSVTQLRKISDKISSGRGRSEPAERTQFSYEAAESIEWEVRRALHHSLCYKSLEKAVWRPEKTVFLAESVIVEILGAFATFLISIVESPDDMMLRGAFASVMDLWVATTRIDEIFAAAGVSMHSSGSQEAQWYKYPMFGYVPCVETVRDSN